MNEVLTFLTDKGGWFAAIAGLLSIVATTAGLVALHRARAKLVLSSVNVTPPPEYSPRAELRFQMSNAGKGAVFVNSVSVEVESRVPCERELIVRPGAPVPVHGAELTLKEGIKSYEIITQRYSCKQEPRELKAHESEAFVVSIISDRGWTWRLRIVVDWYKVSASAKNRSTCSKVVEIEYPKAAEFL